MGKKGLLFLNGDAPSCALMNNIDFSSASYCTDGAYLYLKKFCAPSVLIGDFDSLDILSEKLPESVEVVKFGVEKDFTDGFLALKIMIERNITDVDIYGAFGGRADHEMSNYLLLSLALKSGIAARFVGEQFDVYMTDKPFSIATKIGKIISLVPFSDSAHILYTKGLQYNIENLTLNKIQNIEKADFVMGVSNRATSDTITYEITRGIALIYVEK